LVRARWPSSSADDIVRLDRRPREVLLTKGWREGSCWTCGRSVVTNGLSICDPDPNDAGTVVIGSRRGEPNVVHREDVLGRIPLWQAHFFTCGRQANAPAGQATSGA
jgi:hypothetical protein